MCGDQNLNTPKKETFKDEHEQQSPSFRHSLKNFSYFRKHCATTFESGYEGRRSSEPATQLQEKSASQLQTKKEDEKIKDSFPFGEKKEIK